MMKNLVTGCAAILFAFNLAAQEAEPAPAPAVTADAAAAAPVAEEAPPLPDVGAPIAAPGAQQGTDEIDLDDIEDSAEAASRPSVKIPENSPALAPGESASAGTLVDISCDDATLADILRQFRKTTGANIISGDSTNLQRRVSVTLNRVPWLQGLQSILNSRGFRLEPRDGIYFVSEERQLDPRYTRTYALNHASAEDLAKLFNSTYGERDRASGRVVKEVATSFVGANVVVVTANEKVLSDCEKIIKAVDKAVPQIYIEARFIELSNEAMHKLGVQWDALKSWSGSLEGMRAGVFNNNSKSAYYGIVPTTTSSSSSLSPEGTTSSTLSQEMKALYPDKILAATRTGYNENDMSWSRVRAFSGQLTLDDFRLTLSAFEQMNDAKIFSNPKIIVSNGKEARVDMTTKFPNVAVSSQRNTSNGSDSLDISTRLEMIPGEDKLMFAKEAFYSWGITLSVKPRISPDGLINVEIVPTISELDTSKYPSGFYQVSGGDSSAYSSYPIISVKRLTTDFTMKDGSTAVIGGLSRTSEEDIDSGIPYLRKIPWIGPKLFGWKSRGKVQKEILVFVTVGIANPESMRTDIGLPKNAILGREYVEGISLEPGDRPETAAQSIKLDLRPLDERSDPAKGAVDIRFSKVKPAAPGEVVELDENGVPVVDEPAADPGPAVTAENPGDDIAGAAAMLPEAAAPGDGQVEQGGGKETNIIDLLQRERRQRDAAEF